MGRTWTQDSWLREATVRLVWQTSRPVCGDERDLFGRWLVAFTRSRITQECQPAKNRNLIGLISNLSRLNRLSERNSVYCFSTVFTFLQQKEVLVNPVFVLFRFWVHQYVSDLYLTANWSATLFFFSTLFTTPTTHPVENLCAINRPFSVFMLTTAGTFSTDIPVSHL